MHTRGNPKQSGTDKRRWNEDKMIISLVNQKGEVEKTTTIHSQERNFDMYINPSLFENCRCGKISPRYDHN
jgi:hypothetical protein